jgi:outer membrane protein assembly factor BamB
MILGQNRLYSLGAVLSSPIAVDGVLYFGSMDGNVYAVN